MKIQYQKFSINNETFFGGNNTNINFGTTQCHGKNVMERFRSYCCL